LLLWPTMQSPDYGPSELAVGSARTLAAVATALTIVLMLLWSSRLAFRANRPDARPLVAVAWCLIAYFPASNLIAATGPILAERTLYVASIGVAMLVAWSFERIAVWASERTSASVIANVRAGSRVALLVAGAVFSVVCGREYVQARDYTRVWRLHHGLFVRMVEADSLNYRGYVLLALEAKDFHRFAESAQLYARAYALRPSDPLVLADYGEYLLETGSPRYAMAMGQRLMRIPAMRTDARAVTLFLNATGKIFGIDSVLAAAQRLERASPSARSALFIGLAYDAMRDTVAAQAAYRAGLTRTPHDSALAAHVTARVASR
jgi:tetratricopeptide (TPR) repeat protein